MIGKRLLQNCICWNISRPDGRKIKTNLYKNQNKTCLLKFNQRHPRFNFIPSPLQQRKNALNALAPWVCGCIR